MSRSGRRTARSRSRRNETPVNSSLRRPHREASTRLSRATAYTAAHPDKAQRQQMSLFRYLRSRGVGASAVSHTRDHLLHTLGPRLSPPVSPAIGNILPYRHRIRIAAAAFPVSISSIVDQPRGVSAHLLLPATSTCPNVAVTTAVMSLSAATAVVPNNKETMALPTSFLAIRCGYCRNINQYFKNRCHILDWIAKEFCTMLITIQ